jgi:uncharacterized membrane protein YhaH (DUF805 family)
MSRNGAEDGNSSWRDDLSRSLQDTGAQRAERDVLGGIVLPAVGAAAIVIVSIVAALSFRYPHRVSYDDWIGYFALLASWIGVSIFLLGRAYNAFARRIWQTHARTAEEELAHAHARRPILYLRSFHLDDVIDKPAWYERIGLAFPRPTREERITSVFRRYGPVLAIGRPDEKLPALGAARFYCAADRWKEKVAEVARLSQLVVWASGITEGLKWELTHLLQRLPPQKLIIWTHPYILKLSQADREKEWQRFLNAFGALFPQPLPNRLGSARFFRFDEEYRPLPASSLRELLSAKLYPVFSLARWFRVIGHRVWTTDWKALLLSFNGRANRATFWRFFLLYELIILFWVMFSRSGWAEGMLVAFAALLPGIPIGVKRLHDRGKSGWWLLLYYLAPGALLWVGMSGPIEIMTLAPLLNPAELLLVGRSGPVAFLIILLNIAALIELGLLRGKRGPNSYGEEPKVIRYYDWLEGEPRPNHEPAGSSATSPALFSAPCMPGP